MKKKRMKIFKLLVLPIVLILFACEKDLFDEHIHKQRVKSEITLEQFKRETGLNDFTPSIKIKLNVDNSLQRNADGSYELSDFDIDTSIIKRIEFNQKITYTFQIRPVEYVDDRFFNIIYYFKDGWQTNIVEIKPKEENMIQLINGSTKTIDGTLKTIYKSSPSYQTNGLGCETYVFWSENCPKQSPCTPNWCDGCDICTGRTEVVECFPNPTFLHIDSGSSTGGGPSDGQNPSSNSPSNDENAIATSPVINIPSLDEPEKNPCGELAKFNTNNSIQQTLRILKGQSSGSAERGNYISETTNSVGATYLSFPVIPQNPQNPNLLNINAGLSTGKVKGAMHCHINPSLGMIPMFSWADLDALYQISYYHVPSNNAEKDYAEYTVMLSVGSGHYALKFKNFDGQYHTFNNNINQFKEELEKECRAITSMATAKQQQKTFLKYMNKFFGGTVGLYKAYETTNANGDSKINGWSEQTLDESGELVPIDCQ